MIFITELAVLVANPKSSHTDWSHKYSLDWHVHINIIYYDHYLGFKFDISQERNPRERPMAGAPSSPL